MVCISLKAWLPFSRCRICSVTSAESFWYWNAAGPSSLPFRLDSSECFGDFSVEPCVLLRSVVLYLALLTRSCFAKDLLRSSGGRLLTSPATACRLFLMLS